MKNSMFRTMGIRILSALGFYNGNRPTLKMPRQNSSFGSNHYLKYGGQRKRRGKFKPRTRQYA